MSCPVTLANTFKCEWIKARSVLAPRVIALVATVLAVTQLLLSTALPVLFFDSEQLRGELVNSVLVNAPIQHTTTTAALLAVCALLLVTADARYGVLNATFVSNGSKARIAGAKMLLAVCSTLVIAVSIGALVTLIVSIEGAALGSRQPGAQGTFWHLQLDSVVACVLSAVLATGIGLLVRRTVAGIIVFLIVQWGTIFLGVIVQSALASSTLGTTLGVRFNNAMPGTLLIHLVGANDWGSFWSAAAGYAAWAAAFAALGYLVFMRRELGNGQ